MTIPRPTWNPSTYAEMTADINAGRIYEHHYLELKAGYKAGQSQEMAGDLVSMANDGGVLVLGVAEDKPTGRATAATPFSLQGFIERVEQVARSADPPLNVECFPLPDPADATQGVVFVRVPASALAPHQANHRYYGRNERSTYRLSDAEVDLLMKRRGANEDSLNRALDNPPGFAHIRDGEGRFAVVAVPRLGRQRELLAKPLSSTNFHQWVCERITAVEGPLQALTAKDPVLAQVVGISSPFASRIGAFSHRRTASGIALLAGMTSPNSFGTVMWLGIDESGAINFAVDRVVGPEANVNPARTNFFWPTMVSDTAWTIMLAREMCDATGIAADVDIAVRITGLSGNFPQELRGVGDFHSMMARSERHIWTEDEFRGSGHVPYPHPHVGLRGALHSAFGRLLRGTGVGDFFRPS